MAEACGVGSSCAARCPRCLLAVLVRSMRSIHSHGSQRLPLAAASEEQALEALLLPATSGAWLADENVMERLALMTSDAVLQRVRGFGSVFASHDEESLAADWGPTCF